MEERKKQEGLLLRIFRRLSSSKLSMKEYAFALCVTLVQIGSPFVFELIRGETNRIWQIPIIGILMFFMFLVVWKPDEFIQTDLVEFIFFQIMTVVVTVILVSPAVFYYREEIQNIYGFQIQYFEGRTEGMVLIGYMVLIMAASFVLYDVLAGVLLWNYARMFHEDIKNPYFEQIKAARSLEDYETYQKRKMQEAYEKMSEETVYRPKFLFENTKFFRQITEIEQVKPRYHAMMKIYHPDNPGGNIEITQELQKEYNEIAKKYNL